MNKEIAKQIKKVRRHKRIRVKINGTSEKPRLSVFKSNKGMYLQLIDDVAGKTLVSAHVKEVKTGKTKTEQSLELGKILGVKAKDKNIIKVVFDKGSYRYHGRIKAAADGAREGGLEF